MRAALQGFGPYRLLGVVGEGEICRVYRAVKDADGPSAFPVALAIVHPVGAADADAAAAFLLRSEAAQGFFHPTVAATIDSGRLEGRCYAVRELVDGLPLALFLPKRGKGIKPAEAKRVLGTVLKALSAARDHHEGLAHGRLDTGAVMVDSDGVVRLTGFGQADANEAADLLAVARLAQTMCRAWPPEMDAWIDRVQDDSDGFEDPAQAHAELMAIALDGEEKAAAGLARRVKRQLKAMAVEMPERDAGADLPSKSGATKTGTAKRDRSDERAAKAAPPDTGRASNADRDSRKSDRRVGGERRSVDRRDGAPHPEVEAGIRQARWVAALCGAAVLAALVIEVTKYIG